MRNLIMALALLPAIALAQNKPRLFVTDEPVNFANISVNGSGAYGQSEKGVNSRTNEVQADFAQSCPSVIITNNLSRADFVLVLRRANGARSSMFAFGGLTGLALSAHMKIDDASVFDVNGDMVYAVKARTVEKAVKEVCQHTPTVANHVASAAPVPESVAAPMVAAPAIGGPSPAAVIVPVSALESAPTAAVVNDPTPVLAPEPSLGDAARIARQHKACLDLAKDNPAIVCK